jgi:hypothetical protein
MTGSIFVALVFAASQSAPLAECRRLEQAFETTAMPEPCDRAVSDVALSVQDRVDAARLLAFALVTNGDAKGAEAAFLRLLVLSARWSLPLSASPRLREAFSTARELFHERGQVTLQATASLPVHGGDEALGAETAEARSKTVDVSVEVTDLLGRVATLAWRIVPQGAGGLPDDGLLRRTAGNSWTASLPALSEANCLVRALAADGDVVAETRCNGYEEVVAAPPTLTTTSTTTTTTTTTTTEAVAFPWGVLSVAGGVVVVGVAMAAGLVWAFNAGPLAPPAAITVVVP